MDETNRDELLKEVWQIVLCETGKTDLSEKTQRKIDVLEGMLNNALGINDKNKWIWIGLGLAILFAIMIYGVNEAMCTPPCL